MVPTEKIVALNNFTQAVSRLAEVSQKDIRKEPALVDAAIQRFEFCFELCWKTLKIFLAEEGFQTRSPKETFKQAFKQDWLDGQDDVWAAMLNDCNLTSHTYNERIAKAVYNNLADHLQLLDTLANRLKNIGKD